MTKQYRKLNIRASETGFSLIEVLIAAAVLGLLMAIGTSAFTSFSTTQQLSAATANVTSLIERARSNALAAQNDSAFSVRFFTDTVALMEGDTPGQWSTTTTVLLSPAAQISATNLSGGTDTVVFARGSGQAHATGTVTLQQTRESNRQQVIRIHESGLIDIE